MLRVFLELVQDENTLDDLFASKYFKNATGNFYIKLDVA